MFIGNRKIVEFFDNAIASGGLAQVYCLVGAEGIGKRTLANELAAKLLRVTPERLSVNPDYYFLGRTVDEKTGKLKKEIVIKQTRELADRLQNRSWLGGYQAVVIDDAELINEEAGNSLLKLLEESDGKRVMFLLTADENALLPTVRSRCQLLNLSPVAENDIVAGLQALGYGSELARQCGALAWGRPGRAVALAQDDAAIKNYFTETGRLEKIVNQPFYVKLAAVEELFGKKDDDAMIKRERWRAVIQIWQMQWRQALRRCLGASSDSVLNIANRTAGDIQSIIDDLSVCRELLGENINPRLLMEETIIKF